MMYAYLFFAICIFLYSMLTAFEDTVIMRSSGVPDYPCPSVIHVIMMLVVSLVPVVNIFLLVITIMYRRGML